MDNTIDNTEKQFSELRNKVSEQKKYLKGIDTVRKNQPEILELKNSIKDMRNSLESTENRVNQMEDREKPRSGPGGR